MKTKRHHVLVAVGGVAALLAMTACGSGGTAPVPSTEGTDSSFADIEAAARQEGQLVLYTVIQDNINVPVVEAFNAVYPPEITVSVTRLVSGDLTNRFSSEKESGAPRCRRHRDR